MHVFKHPSYYKKVKEEGKRSSNKQQATSSKDPEATSSKQSTRLKPQATSIKP